MGNAGHPTVPAVGCSSRGRALSALGRGAHDCTDRWGLTSLLRTGHPPYIDLFPKAKGGVPRGKGSSIGLWPRPRQT
jgi:hypothetical protein